MNPRRMASFLMIASLIPLIIGFSLFSARNGVAGGSARSPAHFMWERGGWLAAVFLTALGLILLADVLRETKGYVLAYLGANTYFFGAVLVVVSEALPLPRDAPSYPLIVSYVVLALLGQAAMGAALLQANFLPRWVGWTVIIWNIGWLIILPIASPDDLYYPLLHHMMPLLLGFMLLRR